MPGCSVVSGLAEQGLLGSGTLLVHGVKWKWKFLSSHNYIVFLFPTTSQINIVSSISKKPIASLLPARIYKIVWNVPSLLQKAEEI